MHLNGWQRIWIVFTALSGGVGIVIAVTTSANTDLHEDLEYYLNAQKEDVTIAEIESVGEVRFPSELSKTEVNLLVKQAMSTDPRSIKAVAAKEFQKRSAIEAAKARLANANARFQNHQLYKFLAITWLCLVAGVYAIGWSFGWVRRGFAATRH